MVYKGNAEYGTKGNFLRVLESNNRQAQTAIDEQFPPDEPNHVKAHAILSHINQKGYHQATGFLKLFLTVLDIEEMMAWDRVLAYVKTVLDQIYDVRTVSSYSKEGSMLYGMLVATKLLNSYVLLGWIRHSDISSSLFISALK